MEECASETLSEDREEIYCTLMIEGEVLHVSPSLYMTTELGMVNSCSRRPLILAQSLGRLTMNYSHRKCY